MTHTKTRRLRRVLVRWIKRWRMEYAVITVLLYVAALPATVVVFPSNSLWMALLVLFTGFTASLATLADMLVAAEEKAEQEERDEVAQ